jgi:WD40 repeat protein
MGNGISQEQLQAHVSRQESLLTSLKTVVDQQALALSSMVQAAVNYDVDGNGEEFELDADTTDEVDGLRQQAKKSEGKRIEEDVTPEEREEPANDWDEEPTEEERGFMAIKPWLGAMAKPEGFVYGATDDKPDVTLQLEHVYGFRSARVRNNVIWIDDKTVVYFAAGVGIVHDIAANTQRFFRGHTDDIVSIAYHPQRRVVVTGEQGRTPAFYVWDVDSCQELTKVAGFHRRAVVAVAFSKDGSRVASVGLDDNHSVAVHDWTSGNMLASSEGDTYRILDIKFNETAGADANADFVTSGVKHIKFWGLSDEDGTLSERKGRIGNLGSRQAYLSCAFTPTYTVLGTQRGELYLFKGRKLAKIIDAHQHAVFAVRAVGDFIYSGGKDGHVNKWDAVTAEKVASVNLNKHEDPAVLRSTTNFVRAIDVRGDDELIVGTITSSIFKVSLASGAVSRVVTAHYGDLSARYFYGELWGLATNPASGQFVTAGEDSTLRIWNAETRACEAIVQLTDKAKCIAWAPSGDYIAAGLHNGTVVFCDGKGEVLKSVTRCRRRMQCIKFSPSGKLLAVGSADNVIDVYTCEDGNFSFKGRLKGHTSVPLKIDFSADEKFIQTASQSYELLFFNVETMTHHTKSHELKDENWASFTNILGWDVQGIWPKFSDGSDVNAVARSQSGKMLATAEDTGLVKVFQYPCVGGGLDKRGILSRRPDAVRATGHSEHVTEVAWGAGDQRLFSAGGGDLTIFQWKVVQ